MRPPILEEKAGWKDSFFSGPFNIYSSENGNIIFTVCHSAVHKKILLALGNDDLVFFSRVKIDLV